MSRRMHRPDAAFALALIAAAACGSRDDGPPPAFSDVRTETASLAGSAGPIELTVAHIPAAALSDLQVPMLLGRFLTEHDFTGTRPAMVVSYDVWEQLGEDPAVIGTEHEVGGVTHVLVGIAPRGWADPPGANAWVAER